MTWQESLELLRLLAGFPKPRERALDLAVSSSVKTGPPAWRVAARGSVGDKTRKCLGCAGAAAGTAWQHSYECGSAQKMWGEPATFAAVLPQLQTRPAVPHSRSFPPAGTGNSIVVVSVNGFPRQELKIDENLGGISTSFLGFQLMPEVPSSVCVSRVQRWPATAHTVVSVSAGAALGGVCRIR